MDVSKEQPSGNDTRTWPRYNPTPHGEATRVLREVFSVADDLPERRFHLRSSTRSWPIARSSVGISPVLDTSGSLRLSASGIPTTTE